MIAGGRFRERVPGFDGRVGAVGKMVPAGFDRLEPPLT